MRTRPGLLLLAALALAPTASAQDQVGLNTHVPAADLLDLCTAAGLRWARMDGDWLALNPARGRYDWAALDRSVDAARTRGISVFLTLGYTPAWVPRVPRMRSDDSTRNDEPAGSEEWRTFVTEAVRHYRARGVRHFGMWNEANLEQFWEQSAGIDAYVDKILVPGAAAVRAACGDCVVLGPDLAHLGDYDRALDRVLERGRGSIDILTHHIYAGWPETGTTLFSGDNFLQALESRRFPFSRPALREVLDARGYNGEVWITETGLRAHPPGDSSAEQRQATYVRRVLEEQLARRWWTHTFFYEVTDCGVDQPGCPIDGFGLSRPLRTGARSFPGDYRLKPAYAALRDFIRANPAVVSQGRPAACANGLDDDRDGRIDNEDRGCANGLDDNEGDDPPRPVLEAIALAPNAIRVDGDLQEWSDAGWVSLDRSRWVGSIPLLGSADLGARFAARWAGSTVFFAVVVTDDRQVNERNDDSLWAGDSVQLAFDPNRDRGLGYDANDHEFSFALARGAPRVFRHHGPPGLTATGTLAVRREGSETRYEIALPMASLAPARLEAGAISGFSLVVNDNDGQTTLEGNGREGWLEFTPGIAQRKDPYQFGELRLVAGPAGDAAVALDAVTPGDVPMPSDRQPLPDIPLPDDAALLPEAAVTPVEDASPPAVVPPPPGCACRAGAPPGASARGLGGLALGALLLARRRRRSLLAGLALGLLGGCGDAGDGLPGDGTTVTEDEVTALGIEPRGSASPLVLSPTQGSVRAAFSAVATTRSGARVEVRARARWSVSGGPGALQALAPQGDFVATAPGTYTLTASFGPRTAQRMVTVTFAGTVAVEGEPAGRDAVTTTGVPERPRAELAYPAEGAIFPVNLGGIEVHLRRSRGAQRNFSLRLRNALLDLRVEGRCRATPREPGGCAAPLPAGLSPNLAAASEAGPLELAATVRGDNGSEASTAETIRVSWADVPLRGALYYWSTRLGENTTAIHRMDLARANLAPERWFQQGRDAPAIGGERPCVGCHAISRDGRRMGISYGGSDPGSFALIDVATRRPLAERLAPRAYGGPAHFASMSALSPDGSRALTVLRGVISLRRADPSLAAVGGPLFATGLRDDDRATQPQWSDDGRLIAFVGFNQGMYDCNNPPCGERARDNGDLAPYGQIYLAPVEGDRVGPPNLLVARAGRELTNHYPAFSDDARWVVFNRVRCDAPGNDQGYALDRTGRAANCSGYDNPGTRVMVVPAAGGTPLDLRALNTDRTWTNSWPRFGPSHGVFRGASLYWVAFSSKRPYGLRFAGDATGRMPGVAPQLWLAAVRPGQGDVPSGDPSAPAVWLPGQNPDLDTASGNHVPQWVQTYVPTPE